MNSSWRISFPHLINTKKSFFVRTSKSQIEFIRIIIKQMKKIIIENRAENELLFHWKKIYFFSKWEEKEMNWASPMMIKQCNYQKRSVLMKQGENNEVEGFLFTFPLLFQKRIHSGIFFLQRLARFRGYWYNLKFLLVHFFSYGAGGIFWSKSEKI